MKNNAAYLKGAAVIFAVIAAFALGRVTNAKGDREPTLQEEYASRNLSLQTATDGDDSPARDAPLAPASSGLRVHAVELWLHPNEGQGKLVTLDAHSIPTFGPQGFVQYNSYDGRYSTLSQEIGLRFERSLREGVWLYDVVEHPWSGVYGGRIPDAEVVGQIAVEMNAPGLLPDPFQLWDVEPKGTIEGTTSRGFVIRIPLVHFWRYHTSGKDAEAPTTIVIPPQTR